MDKSDNHGKIFVKPNPAKPGTIVCDDNRYRYNTSIRSWGIILPKQQFIQYFKDEKGAWPAGSEYSHELIKRFGNTLPIITGKDSLDDTPIYNIVGPSASFNSDDKYIGVKWFGKIYSNLLDRNLNFEVVIADSNSGLKFYPSEELELIVKSRCASSDIASIGSKLPSYDTITDDLNIAFKYFSGKFDSKTIDGIKRFDDHAAEQVQMYRKCFPR